MPHTPDDPVGLDVAIEYAMKESFRPVVKRLQAVEAAVADLGALREKIANLEAFQKAYEAAEQPTE